MEKAIIGKKIGMTQIFDEAGRVVPVTVIEAGPCTVVQKKTAEKDGYEAIQLGYETVPERKLTKPEVGHQKKAGLTEFKKVLKEFALEDCSKYEVGDELKADVFAAGDRVDVTGISKGHGFQGVVKRHGAAIKRMTHGGGPVHRHRRVREYHFLRHGYVGLEPEEGRAGQPDRHLPAVYALRAGL